MDNNFLLASVTATVLKQVAWCYFLVQLYGPSHGKSFFFGGGGDKNEKDNLVCLFSIVISTVIVIIEVCY